MKRRAVAGLLAPLALCVLAVGMQPALAQSSSASYSVWSVNGDTVTLRFLLPIAAAQRVANTNIEVLTTSLFGNYLLEHVAVHAGGQECPAIDQGYDIGKVDPLTVAAGLYGFEIFLRCPGGAAQLSGVVLQDAALFDRLPGQVNFARVQVNGGRFSQQLFTAHHEELRLPSSTAPPPAGLTRYLSLGAAHIVGSLDRLCFLLGSLLLMRRSRQGIQVLIGLAAGYALSLPVALLTAMVPRANLLDAFVGFLIACIAAQIVTRQLGRARFAALGAAGVLLWLAAAALLAHSSWPVLLLVGAALFAGSFLAAHARLQERALDLLLLPAVFGFLDGFVLPAALAPLQLNGRALLPMLTGFDLGASLTGAAIVASLSLLAAVGGRLHWQQRLLTRGLATDLTAAALGGLGVFWLISRLHG